MGYLENYVQVGWLFDWVTKETVPGFEGIFFDTENLKIPWAGKEKTYNWLWIFQIPISTISQ